MKRFVQFFGWKCKCGVEPPVINTTIEKNSLIGRWTCKCGIICRREMALDDLAKLADKLKEKEAA